LRQAALIAGFSYLLMPVSFAEFYIYPKLVIRGNIDQTAHKTLSRMEHSSLLPYSATWRPLF
jgi:hypothetical protein